MTVSDRTGTAGDDAQSASSPSSAYDSGEIEYLPDGSISIPLIEEELVVTKRLVVRERIIIRKEHDVRTQRIEAKLRREVLEDQEEGDAPVS